VVTRNLRARRSWSRHVYFEVTRRGGVAIGSPVNTVIVLVKPIAGPLGGYFAHLPGDRG
jgi:hypothetical protein